MRALNEAIEGAADFRGLMDRIKADAERMTNAAQAVRSKQEVLHAHAYEPKTEPTFSATPNVGSGQRTANARAKAKAASKARTAQRMRAKGKR